MTVTYGDSVKGLKDLVLIIEKVWGHKLLVLNDSYDKTYTGGALYTERTTPVLKPDGSPKLKKDGTTPLVLKSYDWDATHLVGSKIFLASNMASLALDTEKERFFRGIAKRIKKEGSNPSAPVLAQHNWLASSDDTEKDIFHKLVFDGNAVRGITPASSTANIVGYFARITTAAQIIFRRLDRSGKIALFTSSTIMPFSVIDALEAKSDDFLKSNHTVIIPTSEYDKLDAAQVSKVEEVAVKFIKPKAAVTLPKAPEDGE